MNYRIEEKSEMILTGYKRRFTGVPGERREQEEEMYTQTRALQYMLSGLSGDPETYYDLIANVDDEGYDFYIAKPLTVNNRENLDRCDVLGKEFAKHFESITVKKQLYAIFETEHCAYPTEVFSDLRRRIASEWLPSSEYRLADAPEIVVTHWYRGEHKKDRYRELWVPIEKK